MLYHPGETNLKMADVIIINKIDTANANDINIVRENIEKVNPNAQVIEAASPISVKEPQMIKGKRVLVIEDGPTLTHGGMGFGAGFVAARKFGARTIVDTEPFAVGSIKQTYEKYPHLNKVLPAMGYGKSQMKELEQTINSIDCDVVLSGTPIDITRVIKPNKPIIRVKYELQEIGQPNLKTVLEVFTKII